MRQPLKDRIRKAQKAVQIAAFIEKNKAAGRCIWCGEVHPWQTDDAEPLPLTFTPEGIPVYRVN